MAETQLAVSWDAYEKNICKGLSFMQERGEFVDMTLAADGHYVKVHRMVLSLISPYIKDLITSVDCSHPVIFLNNISYPTLCLILEYIYTGEVMVHRKDLKEMIQAGKALHIKGLEDMASSIGHNESALDENEEIFIETLATENLEDDNELKLQPDISAKNGSNSDQEVNENYYMTNDDTSIHEDRSVNFLEKVRDKPVAKHRLPVTGIPSVQYTMSNQGGLQLIVNRYIYNMRYMSKNCSRRRWNCIHYPGKIKCSAYVITENDRVIERGRSHNHAFHDKLIMKKYQAGMTYCTLKDAEQQVEIKKGHKAIDEDEDNV